MRRLLSALVLAVVATAPAAATIEPMGSRNVARSTGRVGRARSVGVHTRSTFTKCTTCERKRPHQARPRRPACVPASVSLPGDRQNRRVPWVHRGSHRGIERSGADTPENMRRQTTARRQGEGQDPMRADPAAARCARARELIAMGVPILVIVVAACNLVVRLGPEPASASATPRTVINVIRTSKAAGAAMALDSEMNPPDECAGDPERRIVKVRLGLFLEPERPSAMQMPKEELDSARGRSPRATFHWGVA